MKRLWKNLASVVGGEAAVRAANFVGALFIARIYGGEVLGIYAACLAVVTVVVMFADNGMQTWAITQISPAGVPRNQIMGRIVVAKTILSGAATIGLAFACVWLRVSPFFWSVGAWVAARTVLQSYSQLQMAALKAISRANTIGTIQCIHSGLLFAVIGLTFMQGWSVFALLAGMTAGQAFELALGVLVAHRAGLHVRWPQPLAFWSSMRKSAPFGISYGFANLIVRIDTIVLSALVSLAALGAFSAANTVLLFVYVSSWLLGSIVLPEMVRRNGDPEKLRLLVDKWARTATVVMVPSAALACWAAPQMITVLFGKSFATSGTVASVMALASPFIVLNSIYTSLAIALNRRAIFVGLFAATAIAAFALDFLLGRTFGARGVAWAIVLREAGMFLGFLVLMWRAGVAVTTRQMSVPATRNQGQLSERV